MKVKKGQSIVEVVIAAALISVAIISALSLMNYSQKQTNSAKTLAEATKYNYQAADWLRAQKNDLGFAEIAGKTAGIYCLNTLPAALPAPGACNAGAYIAGTFFTRQLTLDNTGATGGIIKATITTSWLEKTAHTTSIELELNQWQ